jgi:hypothetical protein
MSTPRSSRFRAIEARSPKPVESLILTNCRHSPQFDEPRATIDAIAAFCKKRLGEDR